VTTSIKFSLNTLQVNSRRKRHRPAQRPNGLQRLKEPPSNAKGLVATVTKRYQLPFITADATGAKTLTKEHYQSQVRAIGGTSDSEVQRSSRSSAQGRWLQDRRNQRNRHGWRYEPVCPVCRHWSKKFSARTVIVASILMKSLRLVHAIQGAQILLGSLSNIVLVDGYSAFSRPGNARWHFHQVDREEHNISDNEERKFHHGRRQSTSRYC